MDCTKEACNKFNVALKGSAILDGSSMRDYFKLNSQNPVETHISASDLPKTNRFHQTHLCASLQVQPIGKVGKEKATPIRICDANAEALAKLNQTLVLKAYSPNTITTYYTSEFRLYLQTLGNTTAESLATIVVSG